MFFEYPFFQFPELINKKVRSVLVQYIVYDIFR